MPSYGVSSTIFGSIRIILTSSGVARASSDTSIELTKLDLPEPVEPAHSRCGIFARFAVTMWPSMSLPRPITIGWVSLAAVVGPQHVAEADHLAVRVRHLDAHRGLAGDRREQAHVVRRHRVGDVLGQGGDLLDLHARAQLHLVPGHRRASGEAGDLRVDRELVQHAGDRLDHGVVGAAAGLRRVARLEDVRVGQRVVAVHHARGERELGLLFLGLRGLLDLGRLRALALAVEWDGEAGGLGRGRDLLVDRGLRQWELLAFGAFEDIAAWRRRDGRRRRTGSAAASASAGSSVAGQVDALRLAVLRVHAQLTQAGRDVAEPGPGEHEHAEAQHQQEHRQRDPRGDALREQPAGEVAERAARVHAAEVVRRQVGEDVQDAEDGQDEQQRADHEPRPLLRLRVRAHQRDADHQQRQRQRHGGGTHHGPRADLQVAADRTGRAPPDAGARDHAESDQRERESVTAVRRLQLLGAPDRAGDAAGALGEQAPAATQAAEQRTADRRLAGGPADRRLTRGGLRWWTRRGPGTASGAATRAAALALGGCCPVRHAPHGSRLSPRESLLPHGPRG